MGWQNNPFGSIPHLYSIFLIQIHICRATQAIVCQLIVRLGEKYLGQSPQLTSHGSQNLPISEKTN